MGSHYLLVSRMLLENDPLSPYIAFYLDFSSYSIVLTKFLILCIPLKKTSILFCIVATMRKTYSVINMLGKSISNDFMTA